MAKTRIMLVDDHEVVRLGFRAVFELEQDFHIVGEASDGEEAVAKISVLDPHVVLMDVRMQGMGGIEACREIKSRNAKIAVLMITSFADDEAMWDSILAGADGYLLKNVSRSELLRSIRHIAAGNSLLDEHTKTLTLGRVRGLADGSMALIGDDLTDREREVLALVARGYTNKQIAEELSMSEKTARNHVSHILEKLGLSRRSEAAAHAIEHRLIPRRSHDR